MITALLLMTLTQVKVQGDTPLMVIGEPITRPAMELKQGEPMPFDGVAMDVPLSIKTAQRIVYAETVVKETEGKWLFTPAQFIAVMAGVLVVGATAGAVGAYALQPKAAVP